LEVQTQTRACLQTILLVLKLSHIILHFFTALSLIIYTFPEDHPGYVVDCNIKMWVQQCMW